MSATLWGIPSSHPALAGQLMLEHKGVPYRRIDLVAGAHWAILRALGFPGKTVPAVNIDGAKVQGTTDIALALDALVRGNPLFPRDPERRREVQEAEAWGNEVLQPVPRRLVWNGIGRDRSELATYLEDAKLGIPIPVAARVAPPIAMLARRLNRATDEAAARDLAALPGLLDRVDDLIERGVIGGAERNAADYQIGTSISLLLTMDDLRPMIEDRPAGRLAREVVTHQPGHLPHVFAV
jgi:glutathione S-transferase